MYIYTHIRMYLGQMYIHMHFLSYENKLQTLPKNAWINPPDLQLTD